MGDFFWLKLRTFMLDTVNNFAQNLLYFVIPCIIRVIFECTTCSNFSSFSNFLKKIIFIIFIIYVVFWPAVKVSPWPRYALLIKTVMKNYLPWNCSIIILHKPYIKSNLIKRLQIHKMTSISLLIMLQIQFFY